MRCSFQLSTVLDKLVKTPLILQSVFTDLIAQDTCDDLISGECVTNSTLGVGTSEVTLLSIVFHTYCVRIKALITLLVEFEICYRGVAASFEMFREFGDQILEGQCGSLLRSCDCFECSLEITRRKSTKKPKAAWVEQNKRKLFLGRLALILFNPSYSRMKLPDKLYNFPMANILVKGKGKLLTPAAMGLQVDALTFVLAFSRKYARNLTYCTVS